MAGSLVNNYSQLDSNILEMQLTLDQTRKGKHDVGLTNYDTTAEPQIAAGSVIEVNGGLYKFTSNETILDTEGVGDGTVYIMIVPATGSCTAEYTNTAPTWDDSKQGWYGTASTAGYRYLEFKMTKAAAAYGRKRKFFRELMELNVDNVNYGSVPAAGFLSDGTPYFIKALSFSFSASATSNAITHGISSAETSLRIINCQHVNSGGDVNQWGAVRYVFGDTTFVMVIDSAIGSTPTASGTVYVWYK